MYATRTKVKKKRYGIIVPYSKQQKHRMYSGAFIILHLAWYF